MQERKEQLNRKIFVSVFTKEQPNSYGRKNEDVVLNLENNEKLVGLIVDGGTALSTLTATPTENFNGYFAANTAADGVKNHFTRDNNSKSLLLAANKEIANKLKRAGIDANKTDSEFLPTCGGASLITINKKLGLTEISQIGDTAVIIVFKNGNTNIVIEPTVNYEDINAYKRAKEISETFNIEIGKALNDKEVASILTLGRHKENIKSGYGALNGKEYASRFIKTRKFRTSKISRIIALTDGMYPPQHSFSNKLNCKTVAEDITLLGPERFYTEKVFLIKESDPELVKYPRFKRHDDASLLMYVFE